MYIYVHFILAQMNTKIVKTIQSLFPISIFKLIHPNAQCSAWDKL